MTTWLVFPYYSILLYHDSFFPVWYLWQRLFLPNEIILTLQVKLLCSVTIPFLLLTSIPVISFMLYNQAAYNYAK